MRTGAPEEHEIGLRVQRVVVIDGSQDRPDEPVVERLLEELVPSGERASCLHAAAKGERGRDAQPRVLPEPSARVRPFEGPTPVREVGFVRIREHLRREIADAVVGALLATLPPDLIVKGARASRRPRVLSPRSEAPAA